MNNIDLERYTRQISLPEIGIDGQKKLSQTRVLIVGVGGLGSPISIYLTAAGVGTIGLIDNDVVSISNLHRQVLYGSSQVDMPKTDCAYNRLHDLNPNVIINTYNLRLDRNNAEKIFADYDYIVDACDNFATRYIINDVCKALHKTYVYGAIAQFHGQVAVFDYSSDVDYNTLYPDREYFENFKATQAPPVIGVTPAIVGILEVQQVLQLVCGFGSPLINELLVIDLLSFSMNRIKLG